ncbi:hypothetical protein [Hymenobacter sp. APR13]|uniref:hypothetical protein n=1 Tax=Hymenobacter sp. APR13 TaxID=1356852 RepID=UPI0004E066F0|nr:hypothetical protein [Hymenobacter sp. APR13]AII53805.1 hypothetical protein N008_17710 [Hymenobacter sp. APR13]
MDSISFNPAMLAAVLAGRKTVTRRRLAPTLQLRQDPGRYGLRALTAAGALFADRHAPDDLLPPVPCPFGPAGTVLHVQEAPDCRLRVVSIQLEQVRGITEAQARQEGLGFRLQQGSEQWGGVEPAARAADGFRWYDSAVRAFQGLFDSIYPDAWARNEWVWVVEFARVP